MNVDLVLAPNPGPLTGAGTNTWIVHSRDAAVIIDPGPTIPAHLDAIVRGIGDAAVAAVLVTHTHPDHAPAANGLAERFGCPAVGFAVGPEFSPDRRVADGDAVPFGGLEAVCIATPGHTPDSVCFRIGDALFAGDHIMGGSTVVVEDMSDYLNSLRKLGQTGLEVLYPGHGPVIDAPDSIIEQYIEHRLERERQITSALSNGAGSVGAVVTAVYHDVDRSLHPLAAVSVMAHLEKLRRDGRVVIGEDPTWDSRVTLT
jgi:glyoxylase-like metal-dependent hydrolase (beta-lactamase superfamily II)